MKDTIPAVDTPLAATKFSTLPASTSIEDTTSSFAISPVTLATIYFQSPNPSGTNSHSNQPPTVARMLALSSTIWNLKLKFSKYHITTDEAAMTVPARKTKCLSFCHICMLTLLSCGTWYAGNSMINGVTPFCPLDFLSNTAASIATAIPMKYIPNTVNSLFQPTLVASTAAKAYQIGLFAPQEKNGARNIVCLLSLSFSIVRVAIIPGTAQPKHIRSGINDLPDKPIFLNALSIMKATLAIYPVSSSMVKKRNNNIICGMKDSTPNTPASMPSQTTPYAQSGASLRSLGIQPPSSTTCVVLFPSSSTASSTTLSPFIISLSSSTRPCRNTPGDLIEFAPDILPSSSSSYSLSTKREEALLTSLNAPSGITADI